MAPVRTYEGNVDFDCNIYDIIGSIYKTLRNLGYEWIEENKHVKLLCYGAKCGSHLLPEQQIETPSLENKKYIKLKDDDIKKVMIVINEKIKKSNELHKRNK